MTTYRLMDGASGRPGVSSTGTQPPATATTYSGSYVAGLVFRVTQGNMWFTGYWWWVASTAPVTGQKFCLWSLAASGAGAPTSLVPGTTITSGTLSAGWNYVPLGTPVQLAIGQPYIAAVAVNGNFPDTTFQFGAGDPYVSGITNGPLNAYPSGATAAYGFAQSPFSTTISDPTAGVPASNNHDDLLWLDVQVQDTAPAGYAGSYRIWPNAYGASPSTTLDAAQTFILATEAHLSQSCTLNAIWYYSPSTAASLATWCGVYDISGPALVASNASPSWKKPDGTTSATAGSGWARCAFTSVTLPAGSYKVAYYNSGGGSGSWSPTQYGYFNGSGSGASGITSGPLTVPSNASGASAYIYLSSGGSNTPPFSGLGQEPANGTFAQTGPQYPYLCVDQPGFGDGPAGAVAESFWADMEVTPLGPPPSYAYSMRRMP